MARCGVCGRGWAVWVVGRAGGSAAVPFVLGLLLSVNVCGHEGIARLLLGLELGGGFLSHLVPDGCSGASCHGVSSRLMHARP